MTQNYEHCRRHFLIGQRILMVAVSNDQKYQLGISVLQLAGRGFVPFR
ncbi:MAG: hypothetical protein RL217_483 [Pseudomonadota bacterium]|jgi:hypothetical protein